MERKDDIYLRKLDIKLVAGEFPNRIKEQVRTPKQLSDVFMSIKDMAQETALAVYFHENLEPIAYDVLSLGTETASLFSTREMYFHAFAMKAHSFALLHNHPRGNPEPSRADDELFAQILQESSLLRLRVLDFLIISESGIWSYFEERGGNEYPLKKPRFE